MLGAAAALYVIAGSLATPDPYAGLRSLAHGEMAKLRPAPAGAGTPPVAFRGPDGAPVRLSDFRGKVLVVNLWATWCAPCVKEMPTLAKLQQAYAGKPVQVIALSQDSPRDADKARAFIARNPPLAFYQDAAFAMAPAAKPQIQGFPTTLIFDAQGHERAYLEGPADWSSPEARAVIESALGH